MPRSAAMTRLTVDAVLRMAQAQALRHADAPLDKQMASPALREAVGQVWALVKGRLGPSEEVARLDALIGRITRRP